MKVYEVSGSKKIYLLWNGDCYTEREFSKLYQPFAKVFLQYIEFNLDYMKSNGCEPKIIAKYVKYFQFVNVSLYEQG